MIEITCTEKQKKIIIKSLLNPLAFDCLWPDKHRICEFDMNASCERCFERNIKWNIIGARDGKGA